MTNQEAELVVIDYNEISCNNDSLDSSKSNDDNDETLSLLLTKLDKAFGPEGAGIIGIRNVPGFVEAKENILSLAYPLAHLDEKDLQELEDPDSLYNAGWSHGKEKLKADVPDTAKASFYFNPITDIPGTPEDRKTYPVSYPLNKWPTKSLPDLEPAAKHIGRLMKEVAVQLSKHIDSYALSKNKNYKAETLFETMKNSDKVKGRLLYYYPLEDSSSSAAAASEDSWIGWHNDSGFLTALAGDLYMTPSGEVLNESTSSDAGLYVVDRNDHVRKVNLPKDCMAIQIGECTQIITGGAVVATPHCVKGAPGLARASLACFIDTPPSFPLRTLTSHGEETQDTTASLATSSSRVPPLKARWEDGMTFGEFLQKTFQMYYEFNQ